MLNNVFPQKSCHYETMGKNMVQPDRPQTIQDGACGLDGGKLRLQTLKMCNTYCFSAAKMVTRTHLNVPFIRILLFQLKLPSLDASCGSPRPRQGKSVLRMLCVFSYNI